MIKNAVIYARYSSDKQREASIEDQVRNCTIYAQRNDFRILEVYADQAISGSRNDRPEYLRMLQDAEDGNYDALLVDDLSRLSRDAMEMERVIRKFTFKKLQVIGVSDGYDNTSKGHKIHSGMKGLMGELYLEDLRAKTHRGMMGCAIKGYNTGGRTYGYNNVALTDESRKDEYGRPMIISTKKEINHEEAKWVLQIYTWYAEGWSARKIAAELNRLEVPSPRRKGWAFSAIYGDLAKGIGILNNDLYIGKYIWNRTSWTKNPDTGRRKRNMRPEEEWQIYEKPDLRIVPQVLWEQVKGRQNTQRDKSSEIRILNHTKARSGAPAKYLFSGLLKCGCCGSNFIVVDYYRYGCARHRDRGPAACSNNLKVTRSLVEFMLLNKLREQIFTKEGIEIFREEADAFFEEKRKMSQPKLKDLQKRLTAAEKEIKNLIEAMKQGIFTMTTKIELQALEKEKTNIEATMASAKAKGTKITLDLPKVLDQFTLLVRQMEGRHDDPKMTAVREGLAGLVGGEITLRPDDANDHLVAEASGDYAGLLQLAGDCKLSLVAGARFELTTFRL